MLDFSKIKAGDLVIPNSEIHTHTLLVVELSEASGIPGIIYITWLKMHGSGKVEIIKESRLVNEKISSWAIARDGKYV